MKKLLTATVCSALALGNMQTASAQKCAHDIVAERKIAQNPVLAQALLLQEQDIQARVADFISQNGNSAAKGTGTKYVVPLVFHVVLSQAQIDSIGGTQAVYSRIASQVAVLNTDFNAQNTDSTSIPAVFKPLFAGMDIAFAVAHKKPDGSATSGVEIKITPNNSAFEVGYPNIYSSVGGGLDPWDNKKYLNIWVTRITLGNTPGQVLGFGVSPSYAKNALQNTDATGIVMHFLAIGRRTGPTQLFFGQADRGRTLVHEMGHFFTLNHIWGNTAVGSGSCSDDDGVADTPPQNDANQSNCPSYPKANCTNSTGGEMFMNFMDYVNDNCMRMFTKGQVARMQSEFTSNGGSYQLQFNGDLTTYPTGVNELEANNTFDITPNPTAGKCNISFTGSNTNLKGISVINMVGQIVKRIDSDLQNQSIQIDLSNMQKGIYMIQCNFAEGQVTRKIIVE